MSNVEIVVEEEPPGRPAAARPLPGHPADGRGSCYSGALPDKITIYRGPLERLYGRDQETLSPGGEASGAHEIAHHFGISDERLIELDRY